MADKTQGRRQATNLSRVTRDDGLPCDVSSVALAKGEALAKQGRQRARLQRYA